MPIRRPPSSQPIPAHARCVFKGVLFDVYQWEQELFDGTTATFERIKRPDTVVVFPVLPDGRIILTEQEQPGKAPFIGTTGGRVDEGEDILSAAQRELREESGYAAASLELWDAQQPVGKIDWAVFTFIAKGLTHVSDLDLDAGEKITLKFVTFDELIEIGMQPHFFEREIVRYFIEAKWDAEKREALRQRFAA